MIEFVEDYAEANLKRISPSEREGTAGKAAWHGAFFVD